MSRRLACRSKLRRASKTEFNDTPAANFTNTPPGVGSPPAHLDSEVRRQRKANPKMTTQPDSVRLPKDNRRAPNSILSSSLRSVTMHDVRRRDVFVTHSRSTR
jgi:hypothetical protein